jgi:aminopeptidase
MFDSMRLEKYADVLIWGLKTSRKKPFANGDVVLVRFDAPALPLVEALYGKLLDLRLNPVVRLQPTAGLERSFYDLSGQKQLTFVPPGEKELVDNLSGLISILAPQSLTHLSHVDPASFGMFQKSRKFLRDIMDRREEQGEFGWTLCLYPTPALAEKAGLSIEEYARQIEKACYLNMAQPEQDWQQFWNAAQEIKAKLNSLDIESYHIESERTDLRVVGGLMRRWVGITGHNIPSFEMYISPDWRGTEGVFYADLPSYRSGNYIKGVKLTFKAGVVTDVQAEQGQEFTIQQLNMDQGARRLGEFSLTDRRFSRIDRFMAHTLYDENIGGQNGNCHVAVGSSYSDTYAGDPAELTLERKEELGFNNSALHWDLINTEAKRVTAHLRGGGKTVIYEQGMFTL